MQFMTIIILGRQPRLGLAELESLFGAEKISVISDNAAVVDVPADQINRQELGGAIKVATLLTEIPTIEWSSVLDHLHRFIPEYIAEMPDGKLKFGLSLHGFEIPLKSLQKAGLTLKKTIKQHSRSVRLVPNTSLELNSAQVLHNKLTSTTGWELLLIKHGEATMIARTVRVQDIESYTFRDRSRPKRDAYVGMLPPKLAQTMIHLTAPSAGERLLDPFCGTGVILQEAALYGLTPYGTDISSKMTDYSQANLEWLKRTHHLDTKWEI